MCDAVVVPKRPLNETLTVMRWFARSKVTVANPVPGEALGGLSAGPLRFATYVIGFACAICAVPNIRIANEANTIRRFTVGPPFDQRMMGSFLTYSDQGLAHLAAISIPLKQIIKDWVFPPPGF